MSELSDNNSSVQELNPDQKTSEASNIIDKKASEVSQVENKSNDNLNTLNSEEIFDKADDSYISSEKKSVPDIANKSQTSDSSSKPDSDLKNDLKNIITDVNNSDDPEEFNIYSGLSHTDYPVPKWAQKLNSWRRSVMSEFLFLMCLASILGIGAGFAAHVFNRMISIVADIFLSHIKENSLNWWLIPLPVVGILLSGIFTRYVVKTNLTHGVTQLMADIYKGEYKLKSSLIFSPLFGGTITLGLGGSAGSEGPIAYAGAAMGSNLGRILGLNPEKLKFLIGCGAAAGISGIFLSPIGGVLFTLEFLKMEFLSLSTLAIVVSCLFAYGTAFLCGGCIPSSMFTPGVPLEPNYYWSVLLLGLFCGLYSVYYTTAINITDRYYRKIVNPWYRNLSGGLIVGICLFLFPCLYGVGYPVLSDTIHDHYRELLGGGVLEHLQMGKWGPVIIAVCVLLIKCWACGTTNASGGVSSDFAPTLFAGGVAGFLFANFSNVAFGTDLPEGLFAFLGMAGVMAGTIEAPLMTIFIVLNMGLSYNYALAVSLSALLSYLTVRFFANVGGYDAMMVKHLQWFRKRF